MPFFDDSGIAAEQHRGPVVHALAVFGEQVERMVALSLAWSATLLPALVALAMPALPGWLRFGLLAVTSLALVVATGALYTVVARVLDGEQVDVAGALAAVRETAPASLRTLSPLLAVVFAAGWSAPLVSGPTEIVFGAALLLTLVCATYWGPLLAAVPDASALGVLRGSAVLVWRFPGRTLRTALLVLALAALGLITVAGAVLAAPAVVALLQTNLLDQVAGETT
jgi:hypothetical protein